jgi:hypothetical protein
MGKKRIDIRYLHKVISIETTLYYTGWDLDWNWNNMDKLDRAAS